MNLTRDPTWGCISYWKILYGFLHGIAWDCMAIPYNKNCIRNDGIPHRNLCEHGEKFPTGWHAKECLRWNSVGRNLQGTWCPTKETILDYTGWNSRCKIPQGKPCGTRWVNYTYAGLRCTHMMQHVKILLTWSPMKEMIWDYMWWNSPQRNPQGRPCGRYGWLKFYTGSHVGYATFP